MKEKSSPWYTALRSIANFAFPVCFGCRVDGAEQYPSDRNFIVIGNHISSWDPLAIAYSCKQWEISFLSKESLFAIKPLGWLLRKLHAIPVSRTEGGNMTTMRAALSILRQGRVLGIFPEGHRYHTGQIEKMETGVAVLALKSNVPLVPVYISGHYRVGGRLRIWVGPMVLIDDLRVQGADSTTLEAVKDRLQQALTVLQAKADGARKKF